VPDLSRLPPNTRAWIEQSCQRTLGPSLYINCVRRESSALGLDSPSRPSAPLSPERPQPRPVPSQLRLTSQPSFFTWPPWQGKRPTLPTKVATAPLDPSDLFRHNAQSIYVLVAAENLATLRSNPDTAAQGSAVAVSPSHLITNCHVVEDRPEILIVHDDRVGGAKLLWADPESDRCFLQAVDIQLVPVAGVRPYRDLSVGERVYSIGAPSGLDRTLAEGLISGLRQSGSLHLIQTSAPISPGSSGGGLFDSRGNLIGVTTLMIRDAQNLNFAIAAEDFWKLQ
jgi:serine protease Do